MNEDKRAEIKSFVKSNNITDAKVLEHYYIFGTTDLNSTIRGEGAPRSEHYMMEDLQSIIDEVNQQ